MRPRRDPRARRTALTQGLALPFAVALSLAVAPPGARSAGEIKPGYFGDFGPTLQRLAVGLESGNVAKAIQKHTPMRVQIEVRQIKMTIRLYSDFQVTAFD